MHIWETWILQQEKDTDNQSLKGDIERAINRQDKRGRTPLHAAASGNQRSDNGAVLCASRLIDFGASTSLLDLTGQLMLQIMGSDRTLGKRKAYTCVFTSVRICVTCVCVWVRVCSCARVRERARQREPECVLCVTRLRDNVVYWKTNGKINYDLQDWWLLLLLVTVI